LKNKAKILVPNCTVLIGVIDQNGHLKEGEVYVQIRPDSFRKPKGHFGQNKDYSTKGIPLFSQID
jgi:hypothetical protein